MSSILILMIFLDNGREKWDVRYNYNRLSNWQIFFRLSSQLTTDNKKKIIKVIVISILATLFMYKSCVCFYN